MDYCGIDLASKTSALCVMDEQGEVVWGQMLFTDEDDVRAQLGGCQKLRIVIEASPLAEWRGCSSRSIMRW